MPAFSICIPVHNNAQLLTEALESVQRQTFDDYEVIVVDDESEDDVAGAIAASEPDARLRCVRQPHAGCGAARNRALKEARGDYLLWLDSDDLLEPDILAEYAVALKRATKTDLVYALQYGVDMRNGNRALLDYGDWQSNRAGLICALAQKNPLPLRGAALRRSVCENAGGFRDDFPCAEDYEFLVRFMSRDAVDDARECFRRSLREPDGMHECMVLMRDLLRERRFAQAQVALEELRVHAPEDERIRRWAAELAGM